jgi:hypothetical protein
MPDLIGDGYPDTPSAVPARVRYTLTIPRKDNGGNSLVAVRKYAAERLIEWFGGATATNAEGAWKGDTRVYTEPVVVYAVDVGDTSDAFARLHALALYVKRVAAQESVYVTRSPIESWLI